MDINNSIEDQRYQSSSHCLTETDSSTMSKSISSCDLSMENKVINLVKKLTVSPLMRTLKRFCCATCLYPYLN